MHLILGLLGTIITILVLLNRLSDTGIDLTWLNPFAWFRRRAWQKKYQGNVAFSLESPMEVAALLATTVAKIDGEISREEKAVLLGLFQHEFGKTEKEASDLLMSSTYIFGDGEQAISKPAKVLEKSLSNFTQDQAKSVLTLLTEISKIEHRNTLEKSSFIDKVEQEFKKQFSESNKW